jgi:hypothetical protein
MIFPALWSHIVLRVIRDTPIPRVPDGQIRIQATRIQKIP